MRALKFPVDTQRPMGIQEAEDLGSSMPPTMPHPIMGDIRPLGAWKGWPELQLRFLELVQRAGPLPCVVVTGSAQAPHTKMVQVSPLFIVRSNMCTYFRVEALGQLPVS